MWGVLCLHLMGTMTTWMIPRMRERFFRVIAGHSIVDEARLVPGPSSCLGSVRLTLGTGTHTQASLRW